MEKMYPINWTKSRRIVRDYADYLSREAQSTRNGGADADLAVSIRRKVDALLASVVPDSRGVAHITGVEYGLVREAQAWADCEL